MTFLPVVARELRVASRKKVTYWSRVIVGIMGLIFGGYLIILIDRIGLGRTMASTMLPIIGFPLLVYSFFTGLSSSDSLSGEKRDGTLGLLFLTDLKGYDIVLGKLCATGLISFYGLIATVPIVALTLLLGGLTAGEIAYACLILFNAMFFSHALAIMVSSFTVQLRVAAGLTMGSLLFTVFFLPALAALLIEKGHTNWSFLLLSVNPLTPAKFAIKPGSPFWVPLLGSHLLAWAFLAIASWQAPRSWQDKAGAVRLRWRERLRQWAYGRPAQRAAYRTRLLNINPFFWLISRVRLKPAFIWAFLGIVAFAFTFACFKITDHETIVGLFVAIQILLHAALKVGVASEASWAIEEQRHNGGLEFLVSCTPLEVTEILRGCWASLARLFLRPLIVIFLADIVLFACLSTIDSHYDVNERREKLWCIAAAILILPLDVTALGWVGLWMGLSAKKPRQAGGLAIARILVAPWTVFGLLAFLLAVLSEFFNFIPSVPFWLGVTVWLALGVTFDLLFTLSARRNLLTRFRALAVPNFERPIGFFGRIGRSLGKMMR